MLQLVFSRRRVMRESFAIWLFMAIHTMFVHFDLYQKTLLHDSTNRNLLAILDAEIDKPQRIEEYSSKLIESNSKMDVVDEKIDKLHRDEESPTTTSVYPQSNNKTLALMYPLGLMGGYRNQVMRFISFVKHAQKKNISQMLLPSMVWSTTHQKANTHQRFFPVPMDMLFDIEYWNTFHKELPFFVKTIEGDSDCWGLHDVKEYQLPEPNQKPFISPLSQRVLEEHALITPLVNYTRDFLLRGQFNGVPSRKLNLYSPIKNCTHPFVYGDGYFAGSSGRLWTEYTAMPKVGLQKKNTPDAYENTRTISLINQALIPNQRWRNVANQCVQNHLPPLSTVVQDETNGGHLQNYVALHARVETDMMDHQCGKYMEKNLTKIFDMVDNLVDGYNLENHDDKLQGIFLALSKERMKPPQRFNPNLQDLANHNLDVLMERSITENPNRTPNNNKEEARVFQCGELWVDQWYKSQDEVVHDYYGSILPSIIDFYIATHAKIFVGVQGSSWSTDVWNTRYYQGNGGGSYEYTLNGIKPIPNGGMPPPHRSCKEIKPK